MQPRVHAILVARNGAETLPRTIAALHAQLRPPDAVLAVDAGSADGSARLLSTAGAAQVVSAGRVPLGAAVSAGLRTLAPASGEHEWLWILPQDSAPEPGALAALLGAVEVAPSVVVAGPKLMRADTPGMIARYGETMTKLGAGVVEVESELDQGQHDDRSDLLGVAASGMLVRRDVWTRLRGFDPALPGIDAALDFCVRVRLAGFRVIGVPAARIASTGGPEEFVRPGASARIRSRLTRTAQLHRRMVYAPFWAVPLHWLALLPLAIVRSIWHLIAKRPERIGGEFAAAIRTAVALGPIGSARRNLRRHRRVGWAAIAPLRLTGAALNDRRAGTRGPADAAAGGAAAAAGRPSFVAGGGAWVTLGLALAGLILFARLFGAPVLTGGALAPLSGTLGELWANTGYGWRDVGLGFTGAADPFAFLLALLGTLTFWSPSTSIVLVYLAALPLAGLAAWFATAGFTRRPWPAVLAATAWAFAPTFLAALGDGRLGAVLAHLLLPWLVLAALNAARSWSAAGASALLFAATAAAAPVLAPALLLAWLVLAAANLHRAGRMLTIPLPALVLFTPLVAQQLARGNPLGILADPGVPTAFEAAAPWQLALGMPTAELAGWPALADTGGLTGLGLAFALGLITPLIVLALVAPFLQTRALAPLLLAVAGFLTAVLSGRIAVAVSGQEAVAIWPGTGASLYWLGLVLSAAVGLDAMRRLAPAPALAVAVTTAALAVPFMLQSIAGTGPVSASTGRMLPAFVEAESATDPRVGTLVLGTPDDAAVTAQVHRGSGTTLDDRSTLASTARTLTAERSQLADLTANLGTQGGYDVAAALEQLGLDFVLLQPGTGDAAAAASTVLAEALDSSPALVAVGDTPSGLLWRYTGADETVAAQAPAPAADTALSVSVLTAHSTVFGLALLLAVPTGRRTGSVRPDSDEPATTFDEDDSV